VNTTGARAEVLGGELDWQRVREHSVAPDTASGESIKKDRQLG
jgi:hypothetical protein